jgi:adenine-specific DNA-methyltransferase
MDKLKLESPNLTDKNIEKIAALFPNVVTEMKDEEKSTPSKTVYKKGVNFELLRQELSCDMVDGEECYDFTWVGKKASIVEGNRPIRKTLRPAMEQSKNWEETGNLYIEGDNLDVLKLLQESYLNSVKMIYIDPPYNTGNDFIYKDNFTMNRDEYEEQIGLFDEDENRLFQNTESNGRFHSDWCSMLYPRLKLAQNLLTEDGVVFISIDDNEIENLKKLCDEVFGEYNYMALLTRRCMHTVRNSSKDFNKNADYILCYIKNKKFYEQDKSNFIRAKVDKTENYKMNDNDGKGFFKLDPICARNYNKPYRFIFKNGIEWEAPQGSFPRYSQETLKNKEENNELDFNGKEPRAKRYLNEVQEGQPPDTILKETDVGFNSEGTKDLANTIDDDKIFSQPKPIKLISYLMSLLATKSGIVLDFFSGSATTAHAVMQLNAGDGGNRKFIMIQLPEPCDEQSEAYKAGYKNICGIGKERIRRAGEKIKNEVEQSNAQLKLDEKPKKVPDIGFRVLKVDSTNMKDVYYSADEYDQTMLDHLESNIKDDRTDLDLLYGVLLDWGLPLTLPHKIE